MLSPSLQPRWMLFTAAVGFVASGTALTFNYLQITTRTDIFNASIFPVQKNSSDVIELRQEIQALLQTDDDHNSDIVFDLNNPFDEELVLGKITASCSCTKAIADRTMIPPGGTARLCMGVDLTRIRGSKRVSCAIESNMNRTWRCNADITVWRPLEFDRDSSYVTLQQSDTGQPVVGTLVFYIHGRPTYPDEQIHATSASKDVAISLAEGERSVVGDNVVRRKYHCVARVSAAAAHSSGSTQIKISIDDSADSGGTSTPATATALLSWRNKR